MKDKLNWKTTRLGNTCHVRENHQRRACSRTHPRNRSSVALQHFDARLPQITTDRQRISLAVVWILSAVTVVNTVVESKQWCPLPCNLLMGFFYQNTSRSRSPRCSDFFFFFFSFRFGARLNLPMYRPVKHSTMSINRPSNSVRKKESENARADINHCFLWPWNVVFKVWQIIRQSSNRKMTAASRTHQHCVRFIIRRVYWSREWASLCFQRSGGKKREKSQEQ